MKKIFAITFSIILFGIAPAVFASGSISPLTVNKSLILNNLNGPPQPGYFNLIISSVAGTYDSNGYAIDIFNASGTLAFAGNGPYLASGGVIANVGLGQPYDMEFANYGVPGALDQIAPGNYTLVLGDGDLSGFQTNCNDAGLTLSACRAVYGPGGTNPNPDWQEISFTVINPPPAPPATINSGDFVIPSGLTADMLSSASDVAKDPGLLGLFVVAVGIPLAFYILRKVKQLILHRRSMERIRALDASMIASFGDDPSKY